MFKEVVSFLIQRRKVTPELALKNILSKFAGPFQCGSFEGILTEVEGEEEEKVLGFLLVCLFCF